MRITPSKNPPKSVFDLAEQQQQQQSGEDGTAVPPVSEQQTEQPSHWLRWLRSSYTNRPGTFQFLFTVLAIALYHIWTRLRQRRWAAKTATIQPRGHSRLVYEQTVPTDLQLTESIERPRNKKKDDNQQATGTSSLNSSSKPEQVQKAKPEPEKATTTPSAAAAAPEEKPAKKSHPAEKKETTASSSSVPSSCSASETTTQRRAPSPPRPLYDTVERLSARTTQSNNDSDDAHPGLDAFWHWCDVEMSLFRLYEVGRTDDVPVVPPYIPNSRRGQVAVHLEVTNGTDAPIEVHWINYLGREEPRGTLSPHGGLWTQQTWMEHPWVFRSSDDQVLLYYLPDRILPTLPEAPSTPGHDTSIGLYRFTIHPPDALAVENHHCISIDDPLLPFPAQNHFTTPTQAVSWSLLHCRRLDYRGWKVLVQYLTNIVAHPDETKYRHIRTANRTFFENVWNTPARGLLLAVGFVENGAFAELGSLSQPLSRSRVQDVALLLYQVERACELHETGDLSLSQPEGADGFGRAGFGRAGAMNYER